MSRRKTTRILCTIVVLAALSFVSGMVLHKHDEPKITGKIPPEDLSEISRVALKYTRHQIKGMWRAWVKDKDIRWSIQEAKDYASVKVISIETIDSDSVVVELGTGTNGSWKCGVVRGRVGWEVASVRLGQTWEYLTPPPWKWKEPTNTAPVSKGGVVR